MAGEDGLSTYQETRSDLLIRATQLYSLAQGHPSRSCVEAEALVAESRNVGDREALVAALRAYAHACRYLLEPDRASASLDEAVRLARRHGLARALGDVLVSRAALRHELGRTLLAVRDLDRAAELVGADDLVQVDLQRAALAHNAGRLGDAATLYARILGASNLTAVERAGAANNLGMVEASLGHHAEAARRLHHAAAAAEHAGPAYVALVAETRAWSVVQAGRLTEGVARFDEAILLWEKAALPLGELFAEYAEALLNLRLLPEAREQADRAAQMLQAQGVDLMAAEAQLRSAHLSLAMGDSRDAERLAEQTAASLRRQRRPDWRARASLVAVEARLAQQTVRREDHALAVRAARVLDRCEIPQSAADAYLAAGRVAAATGRRALAIRDWERAAQFAPQVPVLARIKGHLARALAAQARGDDDGLLRACRRGLADLATHRAALPSTELRALASWHGAELSTLGLGAVQRNRSAGQVLSWMESTRAAALSATGPDPTDGVDDELGALRAVQTEIARARRADKSALPALLSRQSEVEARIRHSGWLADSPTGHRGDAQPFSIKALRQALAHRTLVEYDVHDGQIMATVVQGRRTRVVQVADRATVEVEIDELRSALHALNVCVPAMAAFLHQAATSLVESLRAMLVAPLAVPEPESVVVVPVGDLQRVPWSAMFDCPVSVAPSATLWMGSLAVAAPPGPVVLAAGPGLDAAVAEVSALADRYPRPVVLTPPHSGVDAVKHALDGAALAHLSCHGEVRADNPTFSCLHLSDGNLTVHELDRRGGVPHRLVLAACDVGGGVSYPGNEVLGFIGTLLTRGAAGVVASTLLVLDHHVAPLMLALHDGIRSGLTLADALHAARAAIDRSDPRAYPAWCTFTAYGAA
ncbi:MAG TPA: CHAT domain-containing protein [Nocardioidaceae bacterium]|nr:CHAT domain-containing protein [Nocardioidaceae bacterium]